MIEEAKKRLRAEGCIRWHATDVRNFLSDTTYSLIVSSSALHWMLPLSETLRRLAGLLAPGGSFHVALMVDGIFPELAAVRRQVAPLKPSRIRLPSVSEVVAAFAAAGLRVAETFEELPQARYASAAAFLKSLNAQGVTGSSAGAGALLNRTELARLVAEYDRRFASPAGGVVATYRVLYVRAGKEST
jgi:SAM-dependent methyltransferase